MKRILPVLLSLVLIVGALSGCGNKDTINFEISEEQLQSICELATLECFFNNVAKSEKSPSTILQKSREFWCEYTGVVKVGIDFSQVTLQTNGDELIITLPQAEVLDKDIQDFDADSIIISSGGILSPQINSDDITVAMSKAQADMVAATQNNKTILKAARNKAKILIENYINTMDEIAGTTHTVTWQYAAEMNTGIGSAQREVDTEAIDNTPLDLRLIP